MININLLREPSRRRLWSAQSLGSQGYSVILLFLAFSLMGGWYWYLLGEQSTGTALREELRLESIQLQASRAQLDQYRGQKQQLDDRIGIIEELKSNQKGPVVMMNSIIDSMPGDPRLWLESLGQKDELVTIEGRAFDVPAIADFIASLTNAATFQHVELDYWEDEGSSIKFKLNCQVN